jgi:hypothetical protein
MNLSTYSPLFAWLTILPALWIVSLIIAYFIGKTLGYKQGSRDVRHAAFKLRNNSKGTER